MSNFDNQLTENILKKIIKKQHELELDLSGFSEAGFRKKVESLFRIVLKENRIALGRREYNKIRPHSASGYQPLAPEAILITTTT